MLSHCHAQARSNGMCFVSCCAACYASRHTKRVSLPAQITGTISVLSNLSKARKTCSRLGTLLPAMQQLQKSLISSTAQRMQTRTRKSAQESYGTILLAAEKPDHCNTAANQQAADHPRVLCNDWHWIMYLSRQHAHVHRVAHSSDHTRVCIWTQMPSHPA